MDITTPTLAIIIAVLSLALSLHTSISTRRASQLQRLAIIRTKLAGLMWKIRLDLSQYERCAKKFDEFIDGKFKYETTFVQDISFFKECSASIGELKSELDSIASTISKYPFSLGAGQIDEVEHRVDSISEVVNSASEKLLPRMVKLVEHIDWPSGVYKSE